MRSALIAAAVSFLAALAFVAYDCQFSSRETCLMSQGLFWFAWLVVFFIAWFVVACFGAAMRFLRSSAEPSEDREP